MGRFSGAVLGAAMLAMSAAPAAASVYIPGPESGTWQRYEVSFSPDVSDLYLSVQGNRFDLLANEFGGYDVIDTFYFDACDLPICTVPTDAPFYESVLRYVSFVDDVARFSVYVPRSYFNCEEGPPVPGRGGECGRIYDSPAIYLDYTSGTAGPVVLLASGTVPEPASWALMIAGFGIVGAAMRRRLLAIGRSGAAGAR